MAGMSDKKAVKILSETQTKLSKLTKSQKLTKTIQEIMVMIQRHQ